MDGREQVRDSCDKGEDETTGSSIYCAFFIGQPGGSVLYLHFLT